MHARKITTATAWLDCVRYSKTQPNAQYSRQTTNLTTSCVCKSTPRTTESQVFILARCGPVTRGPDSRAVRRVLEKQFCSNPVNSRQIDGLLILLNVRLHLSAGINLLISLTKWSAWRQDSVRFPSKVINKVTNCRWSLHQGRRWWFIGSI